MAVNVTGRIEELAGELSRLTGESATEAVERALLERKERVREKPDIPELTPEQQKRYDEFIKVMEHKVWSKLPAHALGKSITKAEEEEILGIGPDRN